MSLFHSAASFIVRADECLSSAGGVLWVALGAWFDVLMV